MVKGKPLIIRKRRPGVVYVGIFFLILAMVITLWPTEQLKAANYTKTWTSTADFDTGTKSNIDSTNNEAKLATTTSNFSEGFTGTTYKDAVTDANWDTVAHKLTLPGDPANGVATDLQAKWKAAVGVTEIIQSSTYDSTNHFIYLGGSAGSFAAYNPANSTVISLTSKISADWSTAGIRALTFDLTNGKVYLGGDLGKFGAFSGGADPANGTWVYLYSKLSSWADDAVTSMTFDSTNGKVYLGSYYGKFGAFTGGSNPAIGTWVYLTAKISADWLTNYIYSMTFDSTNGKVYLAGETARFGVFSGGADPANGTWVYLNSKISANWLTDRVQSLTFDSTNGKVYVGGVSGKFGAFTGGSDPANGTWVYLNSKISADWSTNSVYSMTFDSTNGKVYLGSNTGKFGAFSGGADPANGTWVYLYSKISADWSTSSTYSMTLTFDSTNGKVYLGADFGKFGAFTGGADPANGTWSYLFSNIAGAFVGYIIYASATDTTNNIIYLGGQSGRFAAYKISDGTAVSLTSKISADWSTSHIYALTFDSTNGKVYLGGQSGKFGVFTGGADPANGAWVNLYSKLNTSYFIQALTFDSTNGKVYVGAGGSLFGAFTGGSDPANGTWVDLTSKISTDWNISYAILSLTFDSTNGKIYLGGENSNFGVFTGGADPINGTWVFLRSKITTDFGTTSYVYSLTFDSTNGKVYLGNNVGRFGVFTGGADPANGTWVNLTAKISADWSTTIIYSLTFFSGKIFLGGESGKFGVFTGGADPANGTWTYLTSRISSFWSTNAINAMAVSSSAASIYLGGVGGRFASYLIGYTSNKNGISLAVDSTARPITKATLTATDSKPANTAITYYLSNNGGANWNVVTSGVQYTFSTAGSDLRWKANLTTTDVAVTPEITNIAIAYVFYTASTGTLNLKYDASQAVVIVGLSGALSTPTNTTLVFKVRAAATEVALATATWSDNISAASLPKDLRTINVGGATGFSDNQWSEIQTDFATSDDLNTPTLSDLTLTYVINATPEVQSVTASQLTDGSKTVSIGYGIRDTDTNTNPYNVGQVSVSFKYSIDSGANWLDCSTVTGTGLKNVEQTNFTPYASVWNIGTDLANSYYNNTVKVKAMINDNEQAHNTAELASTTFSIDSKNPAPQAIAGGFTGVKVGSGATWTNDTTPDLTLSATDDTSMTMKISNDNFVTGDWESYATSKAGWPLSTNDGNKTVYARFRDAFGNYADSNSTVLLDTTPPAVPTHFSIFDTSSQDLGTYSITSIWDVISNPGDFSLYQLERSTNGSDYSELATFSNIASDVYADKSLSNATTYYYRLRSKDIHTNYSAYTDVKQLMPVGVDTVAPEISGPGPTSAATSTTASITWLTNEIADSYVEFGTTISYGSMQGSDGLVSSHSVTLVGLNPTTTYHYRVKSRDATSNRVTSADYTFTTTLPEEASTGLNITGATAQKPGADPEEVTIIWTTDKYSTSQVLYGKSEGLGQNTDTDSTLTKKHFLAITHLDSNTKYYYKVKSVDTYGNIVEGEMKYFITAQSGVDSAAISKVQVSDITLDSAIISWETTTVTTSIVKYGTSANSYPDTIDDSSSGTTTKHVVRLSSLSQGTEYHYRVMGTNSESSWVTSDDYVFSTITLPTISDVTVKEVKPLEATIVWTTNTETDSSVNFGPGDGSTSLTTGKLEQSQGKDESTKNHSVTVTSLKPSTKYGFAVKVRDTHGNSATSGVSSFTTAIDITPPKIDKLKSDTTLITDESGNSKIQAIISWSTDEPATTKLKYSEGAVSNGNYSQSTQEDSSAVTSHLIVLNSLKPSTTYNMQAVSKDESGNTSVSKNYAVLTKRQEKTLLQTIIQELEKTFGWVKKIKLF